MSIQIADHIIDPIESYQASAGTLLNSLPSCRADVCIREEATALEAPGKRQLNGPLHPRLHASLALAALHFTLRESDQTDAGEMGPVLPLRQ